MTQKTLLQRANDLKTIRKTATKITDETIELSLAWVNDEISMSQVDKVLNDGIKKRTNSSYHAYVILARSLKAYLTKNK